MVEGQGTLENVDMTPFQNIYEGKRVLLTGHTGFKGSWLALWLHELGAQVTGIALPPSTQPNHWDLLGLPITDLRCDIRDGNTLAGLVQQAKPDIAFHLAAQPLVRRSYQDPIETWSTNVVGTAQFLEACRKTPSLRAIVVITTDKCYENREWVWGYRETDPLGGHDPYSASKAGTELVAASYRKSFFSAQGAPLLATARAGNVIGGGDWSQDRLIPDLVRATEAKAPLIIRSPKATRPWQHVLEPLAGYLRLGQKLLEGRGEFAEAWNFGPAAHDNRTVEDVLTRMGAHWPELAWELNKTPQPHEAGMLHLDSAKAQAKLGWQPAWNLDTCLAMTAEWYLRQQKTGLPPSSEQLRQYVSSATAAHIDWATA